MFGITVLFLCVTNAQWWGSAPRWRNSETMTSVYLDPAERSVTGSRFERRDEEGREGALCDCQGICGYGRGDRGHLMFADNKKSGARGCHWCGRGQYDPSRGNHDKIVYCYEHKCNEGYVSICDQDKMLSIWHNTYALTHRACTCTKAAAKWEYIESNFATTTYRKSIAQLISETKTLTKTNTYQIAATVSAKIEGVGRYISEASGSLTGTFSKAIQNSWASTTSTTTTNEVSVHCPDKPAGWQYVIYMYEPLCAGSDRAKRFISKEDDGCSISFFVVAAEGVTCTKSRSEPPCCGPGFNPSSPNERKFCTDGYDSWTGQCDAEGYVRKTSIEDTKTSCNRDVCTGSALRTADLHGHLVTCGRTCTNSAYANVFVPGQVFNTPNMLSCASRPSWSNNFFGRFCRRQRNHKVFWLRRDCGYALFSTSNYDVDTVFTQMISYMNRVNRDPKEMVPIYYNNWYGECDGRRLLDEETSKTVVSNCKCDQECPMWGDCCEECGQAIADSELGEGLSEREWEVLGPLRQTMTEEEYIEARDSFDKNQSD